MEKGGGVREGERVCVRARGGGVGREGDREREELRLFYFLIGVSCADKIVISCYCEF